jgi:hypothetical protein
VGTDVDEAQRSILAVGAMLNEINRDRHDLLGGAERPASSGRAMTILGRGWSIFTPDDALASLEWLAKTGHRNAFAAQHGTSPEAFHGWDYARMSNVAGWAYLAYLLDRETAWAWMKRAAEGARAAHGSFAELGQSYLRGLAAWSEEPEGKTVTNAQRVLAALVSRDESPFRLPFLPAVDGVPPPDAPVREVEVAEGQSIADAIVAAGPNGRVRVGAGRFEETLRPAHAVEIVGAGAERTIVEGTARPALVVDPNIGVHASSLTLRGGRTPKGSSLTGVLAKAGFVHLEHAKVSATHHGLYLEKDADAHVFRTHVVACGKSGVVAEGGNVVALESEVTGSGLHGIAIFSGELGSAIVRTKVCGAAEMGVLAGGVVTLRDARIEAPGKFGVVASGASTTVTGSKGVGLLVQEGARAQASACVIEGSAQANVNVLQGFALLEGVVVRGGVTSGFTLQDGSRLVMRGGVIEDHGNGAVYAVQGARHLFVGATIRGDDVGIWSNGSAGFVSDTTIEARKRMTVQVLGKEALTFFDCTLAGGGEATVYVAEGGSPRFSRCAVTNDAGTPFTDVDGALAVLEPSEEQVTVELPEIVEDGGGFVLRHDATARIASLFARRGGAPGDRWLAHAIGHAIDHEVGPQGDFSLSLADGELTLRASTRHVAEQARTAIATVLGDADGLRRALDRQAVDDMLQQMMSGD